MKGFWLGCNYWDSEHGTDMWKYFDEKVIREDMECMKKYNVHYLRVFPNWRDFQPVVPMYGLSGPRCGGDGEGHADPEPAQGRGGGCDLRGGRDADHRHGVVRRSWRKVMVQDRGRVSPGGGYGVS